MRPPNVPATEREIQTAIAEAEELIANNPPEKTAKLRRLLADVRLLLGAAPVSTKKPR